MFVVSVCKLTLLGRLFIYNFFNIAYDARRLLIQIELKAIIEDFSDFELDDISNMTLSKIRMMIICHYFIICSKKVVGLAPT